MQVSSLSHHFLHLSTLLGSSGAKKELLDDLAAVCRGLDKFAELNVRQFADFLERAEEYHRTGILPITGKPARKAPAPRTPKAQAVNADEVAARIRDIYERAAKPETTSELVEAELGIVDTLKKKEELIVVAKVLHADSGLGKKTIAAMKEAIKQAVRDMWDESQRLRQ